MRFLNRKPPADLPDVDRTGQTCRRYGHQDVSWGNPWGWCKCCEFTVHRPSGKVLYYGEFHRKVPPHDEAAEQRTHEWVTRWSRRSAEARERRDEAALALLRLEQRRALGIDA